MTDHLPDDLPELDAIAQRAAHGLQDHVLQHLDVERSLAGLPTGTSRRSRSRLAALVAVAALLAGTVAVVGQRGDDGRVRVDLDTPLPDLEPGELSLLGPRDGKDSIQLPLTAEPSTGLHDGDVVTVTGEGFVPGESVGLVQCAREAGGDTPEVRGGVDGCYIADYTNITADDNGVATGTYRVHRILTTPMTGTVDCAAEAERCIVAMGAISDYDRSGGKPITFATDVAPIELPTVEVLPAEGLTDGAIVHLSAAGLTPNDLLFAEVCSSDPAACWQTGEVVVLPEQLRDQGVGYENGAYEQIGLLTDGDGRVEADIPVWRFLPGAEPGTYVDCAVSRCSLRLSGQTAPPTVPLHFTPGGEPPAAPSLGVDPSEGLAPGDVVVVRGTGFPTGLGLAISLCAGQPGTTPDLARMGYFGCGSTGAEPIIADTDGEGSFSTEFEIPDLGQMPAETEECTADGECRIVSPGGAGEPIRCDGVTSSCAITVDWYGPYDENDALRVVPPWFPPAPVPVTFR